MIKVLHLLALILIFSVNTLSQSGYQYSGKIKMGKMPTQTIFTHIGVLVYCSGYDANFNGEQDGDDEPPSLWLLQNTDGIINSAVKLIDLEFRTPAVPARNYFDPERQIIFVANKNSVDTVSLYLEDDKPKAKKGRFLDNFPNAIAFTGNENYLFISVRETLENGFVLSYNFETENFTDTIKAGTGVQMLEYIPPTNQLIILNEGTFGKDDGSVQIASADSGIINITDELKVGGSPNHFMVDFNNKKLYVVCNASNNIIMFSIDGTADTIHLDLPQYSGPREINFLIIENNQQPEEYYAITTYDSKVFIIDTNGNQKYVYDSYGKAEGFTFFGDQFIITTPFEAGSYAVSDEVTLYSKETTTVNAVRQDEWMIIPNPVTEYFTLTGPDNVKINSMELINSLGQTVHSFKKNFTARMQVSNNLPKGIYFLRIIHNDGIKTLPLIVR